VVLYGCCWVWVGGLVVVVWCVVLLALWGGMLNLGWENGRGAAWSTTWDRAVNV
jgi:hypothetical protein